MEDQPKQRTHKERNAGRKAEKKKAKNPHVQELTDKQRNPKAFAFNSAIKAERQFRRKQDIDTKKQHIPLVDRTPVEPPPILVAIVGPPKVGKSLVIQCLLKSFVKQPLANIIGPITVVSGKKRRITFMECNNDINSMIDIAKVADLVLLLVDASFGFEMEIFEFLNICQVHGMPRVMGVLTHLDLIKNGRQLRKTKKRLKQRFWTEVYAGAKLFYLSGLCHEEYLRNEVKNLARFISVMKFRPLTWRTTHPYIVADRLEDLTSPETVRQNPKCDRNISLYGYVRGVPLQKDSSVHIPGCGDLKITDVNFLPDPCPLPEQLKKRSLVEKERLIYAPFAGVGGIVYDKDAVYVELGGSHSYKQEDTGLVASLIKTQETLDKKLEHSEMQLFSDAAPIKSLDVNEDFSSGYHVQTVIDNGRVRRKVISMNQNGEVKDDDNCNDEDGDDDDDDDEDENEDEDDDDDVNYGALGDEEHSEKNYSLKLDDIDEESESNTSDEEEEITNLNDETTQETKNVKRKRSLSRSEDKRTKKIKNLDESDHNSDIENIEQNNKKKVEVNQDVYISYSKNSDKMIKNRISEVLSTLETNKTNNQLDSDNDNESFDDMSDDDMQHGEFTNKIEQKMKGKKDVENDDDNDEDDEDDDNDEDYEDDEDDEVDENGDNDWDGNHHNEETSEHENEEIEDELKWKVNLAQRAQENFLNRQRDNRNLMKIVYGGLDKSKLKKEENNKESEKESDAEEDIGGLFSVVSKKQKQKIQERDLQNQEESSFFSRDEPRNWLDDVNKALVINRFVTGKWKESEDAEELLKLDDMDDDLYGDFEDMETGEKFVSENESKKLPPKDEIEEKKKLLEKKKQLKEKFDSEYDNTENNSYYDELKREVAKQSELNKSEFENLEDEVRVHLEGYRPGMYVRIEINSVPCELINNFDPTYPLIVGGLLHGEENIGFVQTRLKKHRWHSKILKNRDPLILSVGWRRFQTLPIFSKLEDNLRHRMLKYTPEHIACMAHFWGPITPQGTGVLAIQDVASREPGFRISATGSIVELDKSSHVVKKLKLIGVPMKIYKKTAFIKDMFNSNLEVAKFEGAKIKTVSGIRGQIKKAISKPPGAFRATFEDKIQLSDIIFCRTWYNIDIPKFYNPVTSLLLPPSEKNQWRGMKTTGQIKREKNIHAQPEKDSLYTPIERSVKVFKPLVIPRNLQKNLPYKDKPKPPPAKTGKRKFEEKRVAVVRDPKEENIARLMTMIRTNYSKKREQLRQATKKRVLAHKSKLAAEEERKYKHQKELKKKIFRDLSKLEAKKK